MVDEVLEQEPREGETADRPSTDAADAAERLAPEWVAVERIRNGIIAAVLGLVTLVVTVGFTFSIRPAPWWWAVPALWLVLLGLLVWWALLWPRVAYRHASFQVDPSVLEIRRGVWWRSVTSVPRGRVQHTDVTQGPLERAFNVARLVIHTAGTQFATVELAGLAHERAVALRDALVAEGERDAD